MDTLRKKMSYSIRTLKHLTMAVIWSVAAAKGQKS